MTDTGSCDEIGITTRSVLCSLCRRRHKLYGIRRLLLTGHERLSQRGRARLDAGLAASDPDDEVFYAHVANQALRAVYADGDQAAARGALEECLRRRRRR